MVAVERDSPEIEETQQPTPKIIKTKYWELPEDSLEGWRPFSAFIDYRLFYGPSFDGYGGYGKGLNLGKDLMGGIHGARGSCKSLFLSFLLAKKMVSGKPVWTNYPISFYIIEANGELTYYESQPLDFAKFYAFSPEVRRGAVGITELQYYVEARTSGREQNRIATYQIMQLRKTALSFLYDVQNREWVDKRFGWSNDFDIETYDIAKMSYDRGSIATFPQEALEYGHLREGAYSRIFLEDTSGVLTGTPYNKRKKQYGPYQFAGWKFWNIFPTHFIIDIYEAVHSLKKKSEKADAKDDLANAMEKAINNLLGDKVYEPTSTEIWGEIETVLGKPFNHTIAGGILKDWGVTQRQIGTKKNKGQMAYNIGTLLADKKEEVGWG